MDLGERRQQERPHVKIYVARGATEQAQVLSREVELGLEEEGIPGVLSVEAEGEGALELAYAAAQASPLGTGVGIGVDGVVVHYSRLPREQPLFRLGKGDSTAAGARRLGANAARLVKGIPFKDKGKDEAKTITGPTAPPAEEAELERVVAAVVTRVLAETGRAGGGDGGGATSSGFN